MKDAPVSVALSVEGRVTGNWRTWFQEATNLLRGRQPFPLAQYTVAQAPSAPAYTGNLIYITDESGGAQPAFSDGTNWRRFSDRAIIS